MNTINNWALVIFMAVAVLGTAIYALYLFFSFEAVEPKTMENKPDIEDTRVIQDHGKG